MTENLAHTDASGVIGPDPNDKEPWLNSVDVVDEIVRNFTAEVMRRHGSDVEASVPAGPDRPLMKWLVPECDRLNALFLGIIHDGYKTGPWNAPEFLGHSITVNYGLQDANQRTAVRDAFMVHAKQVVDIINENADQPADKWAWMIEGLIERLRNCLLGIPADAGDGIENPAH